MCYQHGNYGSSELEQDFCIQQVTVCEQACEVGNHRAYVSGYCEHDEQAHAQGGAPVSKPEELALCYPEVQVVYGCQFAELFCKGMRLDRY